METINSKDAYYALYERGTFGNRPKTWNSLSEIVASGHRDLVCMRYKTQLKGGAGMTEYNLTLEEVPAVIDEWKAKGAIEDRICFNESMPDPRLIIQGELMTDEEHFTLHYSTVKKPMRLALREEQRNAKGMVAMTLLRQAMWDTDYERMHLIFDRWPTGIVEFSTWECAVGDHPGCNTIFWEVRNY
jgi:hypothetical protein